jgi:hypothetical protein
MKNKLIKPKNQQKFNSKINNNLLIKLIYKNKLINLIF